MDTCPHQSASCPRGTTAATGNSRTGRRSHTRVAAALEEEKGRRVRLTFPAEKLRPVPAEEPLQAGHRCNRWVFYPFAICGTAPCAGSDLPACDRKQLLQSIPAATVPTTNLCLGFSGSVRRASA